MNLSSQMVSLILIVVASALACIGYLHGNSDGVRGVMFTFAGSIVTGAFALLKSDSKQPPPPSDPPKPPEPPTTPKV